MRAPASRRFIELTHWGGRQPSYINPRAITLLTGWSDANGAGTAIRLADGTSFSTESSVDAVLKLIEGK